MFAVNTAAIVLAQLPISHWIEGRRRMRALALMPLLWAVCWLIVDGDRRLARGDGGVRRASPSRLALFGVGECFHGPAHQALVADIGPEHLRGRYFAVHSLSWGLAGTVGPAVGGFILAGAPFVLWPLASVVCLVAAAGALALERYIPAQAAPHPARRGVDSGARRARAGLTGRIGACRRSSRTRSVPVPRPARMPSLPRIRRTRSRDLAVVDARPREPAELSAAGLTWIHLDAPTLEAAQASPSASAGIRSTSRTSSRSASGRRSTTTPRRATSSPSCTSRPTTRRSSG